jgi:tetratricopeptide (TPR) repeat protein
MSQDKDPYFNNPEYLEVVTRYQATIKANKHAYFDVLEFDIVIEYFLQMGQPQLALHATDHGISQHPYSGILKLRNAQLLIDLGNPQKALEILKLLGNTEQNNHEFHLLYGISLNLTGKQTEASKYFAEAIELSGQNKIDTLFSIAVNYENLNFYDVALDYFFKAHFEDKQNKSVFFEIAYCSDKLEDYMTALEYYNKYLDSDPFSDIVWFNLGVIYSKTCEFAKAVEAYEYSITLNDNYATSYYNLGNAQANLGEYENALSTYNKYLEFNANHTETFCFMGECYERMGKLDEALTFYNKALEIEPDFSDAIYGIGIVQSIREKYAESLSLLLMAIKIDNDNSDYWFSLGNVYVKMNKFDKAIESFTRSTELDPFDYESWLNLSEIFFNKNLLSKAIKTLEEAYSYNNDVALINYRLAAYNILRHNISDGVHYFRRGMNCAYEEHKEIFKICPQASDIKEIKQLIIHFNSIKQ